LKKGSNTGKSDGSGDGAFKGNLTGVSNKIINIKAALKVILLGNS